MLSADVLERMYGFRATVAEVSGRRVVLPERRQGARE
jgi:ribosomal protein L34